MENKMLERSLILIVGGSRSYVHQHRVETLNKTINKNVLPRTSLLMTEVVGSTHAINSSRQVN